MKCDHDEGYSLDFQRQEDGNYGYRIHCRLCGGQLDSGTTPCPEAIAGEFGIETWRAA